ncbi:cellulose binding domain-containing protein [Saccharothrix luteola]|uniref:cellulose binding domain-containing protein n=1 Tax=Saccharothrix luteola TaxID=2893018 RepID=UPI001E3A0E33|nr:cellulose binding domain-containing protein [Saccharothrix luteola]MCC8246307.1 cellulose binding domain-containing protein [Saccharothrix luteola]
MKRRHLLASAAAALTLVAAAVVAVGTAQADSGVKVMPLGDSITDGFNVPGGYRVDLWQKLVAGGRTVDFVGSMTNGPTSLGDRNHEGHSGWTIAQIDSNVTNWLRTYTPRTILLHIGTNDMNGSNPGGAPQRLSALVDRITTLAPNAELFVATIVPLSGRDANVRAFNATIPSMVQSKVSAGKKVHLVDMYRALTTADLADGVHPNAGGYSKMATAWYTALLSVPGSIDDPTTTTTTTSQTTTTTSTTTTTTSQPGGGACAATHRVVNSWGGGYQAEVKVANTSTASLNGWTVRLTLPSGHTVNNLWGGVNTGTSGAVSVRNAPYNGSLGSGTSTTFGYVANGPNANPPTEMTCVSP